MKRVLAIVFVSVLLAVTSMPAAPAAAAPAELAAPAWHSVRPGETVFSIGRLYRVSPWAIASANHLKNPNKIYAGQWLWIPAGSAKPPACGAHYTLRRGDTLHSLGRTYGLSPWKIAAANGIYDLNKVYVGQRLVIPCR